MLESITKNMVGIPSESLKEEEGSILSSFLFLIVGRLPGYIDYII
jgi:hypothetical protein